MSNKETYEKIYELSKQDKEVSDAELCRQHGIKQGAYSYWKMHTRTRKPIPQTRKKTTEFIEKFIEPAPPRQESKVAVVMVKGDSSAVNRVMKDFFNV